MSHFDSRPGRDMSEYPAVQKIDDLREAEQALRERERLLDSLMGVLPGSAYRALADEQWNILFISKGIEGVTGYPPEEFTSRRLKYNDDALPVLERLAQCATELARLARGLTLETLRKLAASAGDSNRTASP